ncbi:MAG: T9SS type A sorting domain-containing protein [Paludibacteraceae bacterium]|nr:T9SS type A sorting domain-containing protein [Paludibacteraceae bacterium]
MRKIFLFLTICCTAAAYAGELSVACGDWVELRATDVPDWHFERWSDGNTEAIRQVEVTGDILYTAIYAPNCGLYAGLPVVSLYEWLLMLDVQAIEKQGYKLSPEQVSWYRVNGEVDDPQSNAGHNDVLCGTGYYLTIDRALPGTGDYYAVANVGQNTAGMPCDGLMYSEIVHYASADATERRVPVLEPTLASPGQSLQLKHLDPDGHSEITVTDISGKTIRQFTVENTDHTTMPAASMPGTYQVVVAHGSQRIVLRYIVGK